MAVERTFKTGLEPWCVPVSAGSLKYLQGWWELLFDVSPVVSPISGFVQAAEVSVLVLVLLFLLMQGSYRRTKCGGAH